MTTISLDTDAPKAGADAAHGGGGGALLEASLEQGGFLLQAVGRAALGIIAPQCPCPGDGGAATFARGLYASDAWEEAEDDDERARMGGGASQPGEPPSFERVFAAAGGQARLEELEELSTAQAQAAIRARACMLEPDRAGYDATLAEVRATLCSMGEDAGSSPRASDFPEATSVRLPACTAGTAAQPRAGVEAAAQWMLVAAVDEARECADAIVAAAFAAFDAELAAADADLAAETTPVPAAARAEDARRWRGCEGVAALALERLHVRCIRRLGEAAAHAMAHMRALAASVTERDAALPGVGAAAWPAGAAEKARLVAARAAALNADVHALRDVFAAALARVLGHVDAAELVCPAARLRTQAEVFNGALHAATRAAALLLARALRHLIYVVVAAHLHGALERSMSGGAGLLQAAAGQPS
jgi:hypothetical protein